MNRHIVFTDCHIEENSLAELDKVFSEILRYSKEAPILVCVGDYYEKKNPTAKEIDFGTKWALKFKSCYKQFIMVIGNHPDVDGKVSSVSYLAHLGVELYEDVLLDDTYYGHFMIKESSCGFNETMTAEDLTARLNILGHQHSKQEIVIDSKAIVHPGSCRYVDFGEVFDKGKFIYLVDECTYLPIRLNKVRPMFQVNSVTQLVPIPKDAQVRIVYTDFNTFLAEADELEKYKSEFFKFKVKMDFVNNKQVDVELANKTNDIVDKWLQTIDNDLVRKELTDEFKNTGII